MPHRVSRAGRSRTLPLFIRALLVFVLTLSLGLTTGLSPAAVGAAAVVVTTTADTIDVGVQASCATIVIGDLPGGGDGLISLREAICAANNTAGDDVITFQAGLGSSITLAIGELAITDNLTITGPDQNTLTIDGNGSSRVFGICESAVTISDLTITGGSGEGPGGGIFNCGTLTLTRTTVRANIADFGGGIANYGSLTVSASTIVDNLALSIGGGLYNVGQAQLTDTIMSGNMALAVGPFAAGGGIFSGVFPGLGPAAAPAAPLDISLELTRVSVSGNTSLAGGGIALIGSPGPPSEVASGTTVIDESTISGNEACVGGGIAAQLINLTITNSTISDNRTSGSVGEEEPIACPKEPEGQLNGGGIWAAGALTLTNSTVSGNSADNNGGGLYVVQDPCICAEPVTVAITYSTITGNTSNLAGEDSGGGGIFFADEFPLPGATPAAVAAGVSLNSSIVAGNTGPAGEEDCGGPVTSDGHNLVGEGTGCPTGGTGDLTTTSITAVLNTTLADNGGPTETHALVASGPALDAGDPATCTEIATSRDQRGITRPQVTGCDIGAYEYEEVALLTLSVQTEGTGTVTASPAPASSSGTPDNMTYQYPPGTVVTLTTTPGSGQVFARWTIDGVVALPYGKGWASPLTITLDANHTAKATFAPRPLFSDVSSGNVAFGPITELAARDIIRGYSAAGCAGKQPAVASPCYGPNDLTERAQTAALLTRLLNLEGEDHGDGGFTDLDGLGPELRRAVGTMAFYDIMIGYDNQHFGPFDPVSHLQTALVISRAFVSQGYWTRATVDDPSVYPNLVLSPNERLDLVTFVHNAGQLPGFANNTQRAQVDQPAPRAWTAQIFWLALNGYFGVDEPGKGGFVP